MYDDFGEYRVKAASPYSAVEEAPGRREIIQAKGLHNVYGSRLLRDERLQELLQRYRACIENTRRLMEESRMVVRCGICAGDRGGSCCLDEVPGWYDPVLLLINLLMGVEVPEEKRFEGHCLFVGDRGCMLLARHAFCVNYLCPDLKDFLGPPSTARFSSVAGEEIGSGWEAERYLRNWTGGHLR